MDRTTNIAFCSGACAPALAILCISTLSTFSPPASAQSHPCPSLDAACLDSAYFAACAERGSSIERCHAWVSELREAFSAPDATAAVGAALAGSYFRLAHLTETADTAQEFRERARLVSLEVIATHPDSSEAYIWLSILDSDVPESRVDWLRKATAADGTGWHVRSFVNALLQLRTMEAYLEAIEAAKALYDRTPFGPDKWNHAMMTRSAYDRAISQHPEIRRSARMEAFEQRVRTDSEWDDLSRIARLPTVDPFELRRALPLLCSALRHMFGEDACIDGLERAMLAARTTESVEAQDFADTVAEGILHYRPTASMIEREFSWTRVFRAWLDELSLLELDSVRVYEAMARTPGGGLQGILDARLVIVEREPDSAEARFQAGKAYYDMRLWEEARVHLEIALSLTTEDERVQQIEGYLRQAVYEIGVAH